MGTRASMGRCADDSGLVTAFDPRLGQNIGDIDLLRQRTTFSFDFTGSRRIDHAYGRRFSKAGQELQHRAIGTAAHHLDLRRAGCPGGNAGRAPEMGRGSDRDPRPTLSSLADEIARHRDRWFYAHVGGQSRKYDQRPGHRYDCDDRDRRGPLDRVRVVFNNS